MDDKVDRITLWTARIAFLVLTAVIASLWFTCHWDWDVARHEWKMLSFIATGYAGVIWICLTKQKPSFLKGDPQGGRQGLRSLRVMALVFGGSAIGIAIWVWIVFRH